jgi:chloride channel protein, CIC family
MQKTNLLGRFLMWRVKHISNKQFVLFLSGVVGLAVGLSAVVIKNSVHFIQSFLTHGFTKEYENYLFFVYPAIGIFIAVIFARFIIRQRVGHGIPSVLFSISKNNGILKRHNMFSSIITSSLTVGFGGSVGLEGPTVATGAALGSNIGRVMHLEYKQVILLLGCACAGAMAAIFKAPIAAIVFAMEVIMLDLTMTSLVPLLIASSTAVLTSYLFLGQDVLYTFEIKEFFKMRDLPFYIGIGILSGFISVYFTRIYMFVGALFEKINKWYIKLLLGGFFLGVLIFFFPSLFGEGYEEINSCLKGDYSYLFDHSLYYSFRDNIFAIIILLTAIILFKVFATSITFGAGGVGGIFAPTLFLGANAGLMFALFFNQFGAEISTSNFALVGMAGTIAGVIHAPLTAIFLIAEITNGYDLFIPLMIVSTISYATTKIFESNSVYTIQLAKRGELMTHHKDKNVLSLMKVEKLIEKNFLEINVEASLRDLVHIVSDSTRNVYPVTDSESNFYGIVFLDDIRHIMFKHELYDETFVRNLMFMPSTIVYRNDTMEEVAQKFQLSGKYNLPVIDDGKYKGFVSRANVFSKYRQLLKKFSDE